MNPEDVVDDPEAGNSCHSNAVKHDVILSYVLIIVNLIPLVVGLGGYYLAKSRTFDPIRMFCFSFTTYMGLINVWIVPMTACPGVLMSDYTSSIKCAVQVGYVVIPIGFILSGCEFAWFCTNNRVLRSTKLKDDFGDNMDQSYGFKTIESYFSEDKNKCPLKVEVLYTGRCHGHARVTVSDLKEGANVEELPLYIDSDDFKYDRIEDHSDQVPDLFPLKSWQGLQLKFSQEVLPGDQLTLDQMMIWKVEHEKKFRKYTVDNYEDLKRENGNVPFNHITFQDDTKLVNFREDVMIYDASTKPWYFTPICWVLLVCGVLCLLWIPVSLGVWRIKKVNIAIRKFIFIDSEKYKKK